jgi:hypothetical protein
VRSKQQKPANTQRHTQPSASHDCNREHRAKGHVSKGTCTFGERRLLGNLPLFGV